MSMIIKELGDEEKFGPFYVKELQLMAVPFFIFGSLVKISPSSIILWFLFITSTLGTYIIAHFKVPEKNYELGGIKLSKAIFGRIMYELKGRKIKKRKANICR